MNVEICVVDVDAATYSTHAYYAAETQFPGKPWRCTSTEKMPEDYIIVRTHKIPMHHGMPTWAYCYWREAA